VLTEQKYEVNQVSNVQLSSLFFGSFSAIIHKVKSLSFVVYIQVLLLPLKSFSLSFSAQIRAQRSPTLTRNNNLLLLLFHSSSSSSSEREREKENIEHHSKSTQLSSFVSRLFFLFIPFYLFILHSSTTFFPLSQSLVIWSTSFVRESSHNYKYVITNSIKLEQ